MKAIRYHAYGPPAVLRLEDVDTPAVGDDEVLIRVRAASVNAGDRHFMRGAPYIFRAMAGLTRPKVPMLGTDLAGHVEMVGRNVTSWRLGDEVFGCAVGALAEYVSIRHDGAVARKPAGLTFEQAAAVPTAAVTALEALRGRVRAGDRVLVNGAAGGVGTFAVQIAKALGAEVTGVCGNSNVKLVRAIGADHVIDYSTSDFARAEGRYDLLLDNVGNRSLADCRRVLAPTGTFVPNSGTGGRWIGPMGRIVTALLLSLVGRKKTANFVTRPKAADLDALCELIEAGEVTPVVDRTYPLSEVAEAMTHLETGHARGKIVITM
ncbi:NAD(P)-dependent alcohol dehydrogenase [Nonomuraea sp. NPDC049784]|uniref:NAD(P)-dependent alcohol dehydrogenase n=1 Tax=Nonomuraea sp. NPDC049784 TaxID=3154361 RepID=UPI0033F676CD